MDPHFLGVNPRKRIFSSWTAFIALLQTDR